MPLVSMRQLLDHAAENGYGLPAFNVNNMEQVWAIMRSRQPDRRPGHHAGLGRRPQICRRTLPAPPDSRRPRSLPAPPHRHAPGPRPVPAVCMSAIRSGFTSVMMDGSLEADGKTTSSYEYNVAVSRKRSSSPTPSASPSKPNSACSVRSKPCRATRKTATAPTAT
jgi:fructose-bisphosphate aldolase class II